MYRPSISQLIEALERVKREHGDLEVRVYDEDSDTRFEEIEAEYNDDDGPFCLMTVEANHD